MTTSDGRKTYLIVEANGHNWQFADGIRVDPPASETEPVFTATRNATALLATPVGPSIARNHFVLGSATFVCDTLTDLLLLIPVPVARTLPAQLLYDTLTGRNLDRILPQEENQPRSYAVRIQIGYFGGLPEGCLEPGDEEWVYDLLNLATGGAAGRKGLAIRKGTWAQYEVEQDLVDRFPDAASLFDSKTMLIHELT